MEIHYPNELFDAVSCRKKYLNPAQNKFRDRKGKIMTHKREGQEAPEVPKRLS